MGACPVCGSAVTGTDDRCPGCGHTDTLSTQRARLEQALTRLDQQQTSKLLEVLWEARGRNLTSKTVDGTRYLRTPEGTEGTLELLRLGRSPPSKAELDAFTTIIDEYGFDRGYYVFTAEQREHNRHTTSGPVIVIDRARFRELIEEAGLTGRILASFGEDVDVGDDSNDGQTAFEADPTFSYKIGQGLFAPLFVFMLVFLGSLFVIAALVNAIFGGHPTPIMAIGTVASLALGIRIVRRRSSGQLAGPLLRIDADGITIRDGDEHLVPWDHIVAVYEEPLDIRNPSVPLYTHEFPYLVVEVNKNADIGAWEAANSRFVTEDRDAYVVGMNHFQADFEEVATAVQRFGEATIEKPDHATTV